MHSTNHVYTIDDGTGRIEARHYVDSANDNEGSTGIEYAPFPSCFRLLTFECREGKYARVTGGLKSFAKKRYINVSHIRNIKDPHEIYFHTLEAIAVNLIIERGPVGLCLPAFLPHPLKFIH